MDIPLKQENSISILYVEDDATTRDMVSIMIRRKFPHLSLILAGNGREGLDLYTEHHPDIIVTDVKMPDMDGIQMARQIKALEGSARIIVLTATSDMDLILEAIDIGINHYVLKPIKMDKFIAAVEHCLKGVQMERRLRQRDEEIRKMAYHDPLTGLPNRQLLNELLNQALGQAQRHNKGRNLAVLFVDLDRFKVINDTLGHAVGDQLLQAVAHRLKQCCQRDRDAVARRGGDEFIVLLPELDTTQEAVRVARKIIDAFASQFNIAEHQLYVTTSIGISIFPGDGEDGDTLIRNADMAMYRAKEEGRNRYHLYNPSMDAQASWRLEMESSLRKGLQNGEFYLHYQPEVDVATGRIVSIEALLRWLHPERGVVPPRQFIPIAEEIGVIVPLGEWVLRTACAQNKAWQDAGYPPVRVAVNFSPRQFQNLNLPEMVENVLAETGLDPCWLEVEVTEEIMLLDVEATVRDLHRLSSLGVHISIDDFGTGYSSLSHIKKLPIHTLKIDQSFVNDITRNPDDATIASAIVTMARSMSLNVIAEGVELREQVKFLYSINCSAMQGNYFSKPLPAKEFSSLLLKPHWRKLVPHTVASH